MDKNNENYQLWFILDNYRSLNPAGFDKSVGHLLRGGLEAIFDRLEGSSLTPEQIRNAKNPSKEDNEKLEAFYACIQARNILQWEEKDAKGITQIVEEDDSQQLAFEYEEDSREQEF